MPRAQPHGRHGQRDQWTSLNLAELAGPHRVISVAATPEQHAFQLFVRVSGAFGGRWMSRVFRTTGCTRAAATDGAQEPQIRPTVSADGQAVGEASMCADSMCAETAHMANRVDDHGRILLREDPALQPGELPAGIDLSTGQVQTAPGESDPTAKTAGSLPPPTAI